MTESEKLQATTRSYTVFTHEEILQAAQKVFELADQPDFTFVQTPARLTAIRKSYEFYLLAEVDNLDTWQIDTLAKPGLTRVTATVVRRKRKTLAGSWYPDYTLPSTTTTENILTPRGPAIYRLFFTRLEYLLGQNSNWPTCPEFEESIVKNGVRGELFWLCEFTTEDDEPIEIETPHSS